VPGELLEQHDGEAGLARAGHAEDHPVGGQHVGVESDLLAAAAPTVEPMSSSRFMPVSLAARPPQRLDTGGSPGLVTGRIAR